MNDKFKAIDCGMSSLAVFRSLLGDEIINKLWQLLDSGSEEVSVNIYNYS